MPYYAVIDTNVLVSALLAKSKTPPLMILEAVFSEKIIPLYHRDIIAEYSEVLLRPKSHLSPVNVHQLISGFVNIGIEVNPQPTGEIFSDEDDLIFYEVAVEKRNLNAYLITGNLKDYPVRDFIVSPFQMIQIIQ